MNFFLINSCSTHRWLGVAGLVIALLLLAGCDQTGQMEDQPRYNPLQASALFPDGRSARSFPAGTVSQNQDNLSPNSPVLTGLDANGAAVKDFPVPVTKDLVLQGQERYNIFCIICHGRTGQGNGTVVATFGFPKPPDLLGTEAKGLANGDIFNIILNGRGKMFSYGYRVKPDERWAIISYIRAMQAKNGAVTAQDLTPDFLNSLGKQP